MPSVKASRDNPAVLFIMTMAIVGFVIDENLATVGAISAVLWASFGMQILCNAIEERSPIVEQAKGFAMFKLFIRSLVWGPLTHNILR